MKYLKELNEQTITFDWKTTIAFYFLFYIVCAMFGFLYEEIFYFLTHGHFIKCGFLYGPYLPIYGWGSLLMVLFLKRYKKRPWLVLLFGTLVAGLLEYYAGYFMFQIWHQRWWDYSDFAFNIDGFVCLQSVMVFGIGSIFILYVLEPLFRKHIAKISTKRIQIYAICFWLLFLIDNALTFLFRHPV